jgi:CheY-like chemotaxis protein
MYNFLFYIVIYLLSLSNRKRVTKNIVEYILITPKNGINMKKRFTVLSIEDNKPDFLLLKSALEKIPNLLLDIININNGRDALDFLYKKKSFESAPTPNIIILDINLPNIDGKEILKTIKNDENYKSIPVIVFSTSDYYADVEEMYQLHANSYITKTFDIEELFNKITMIGEYWLHSNELPDKNNFCFINREDK